MGVAGEEGRGGRHRQSAVSRGGEAGPREREEGSKDIPRIHTRRTGQSGLPAEVGPLRSDGLAGHS